MDRGGGGDSGGAGMNRRPRGGNAAWAQPPSTAALARSPITENLGREADVELEGPADCGCAGAARPAGPRAGRAAADARGAPRAGRRLWRDGLPAAGLPARADRGG